MSIEVRVQLLRRIGAGLYGRQWQSALAADLGVNDRTMRRWVSGEWRIPKDAWTKLPRLIADREEVLAGLRQELDKFIANSCSDGQEEASWRV